MSTDPTPIRPNLVIPPGMPTTAPVIASHEAELVSALLDSGVYQPATYGIHSSAFRGLGALNEFCTVYQARAGCAPPLSLVLSRYPSFTYVPDVSPAWAAHNVSLDETNIGIRQGITKVMRSLSEEAYGEALGHMRATATSLSTARTPGRLVTDFSGTRAAASAQTCPVPPGRLADLTGGHRAGHVWYVAALWGVGKTFKLVSHTLEAAKAGWDVMFFSMEMPTEEIFFRLRSLALLELGLGPLPALDLDTAETAMAAWSEGKGRIEVRGPDTGRVDANVVAGAVANGHTLVVVDYVGKMFSTAGQHARTDHQVMALISAELAQTAGLLKVPILGAAQMNRKGELGGTIALEQDADLILLQSKVAESVNGLRKNVIYKTRHTEMPMPWYTRFDPALGDFSDITHEQAMVIRNAEETTVWG